MDKVKQALQLELGLNSSTLGDGSEDFCCLGDSDLISGSDFGDEEKSKAIKSHQHRKKKKIPISDGVDDFKMETNENKKVMDMAVKKIDILTNRRSDNCDKKKHSTSKSCDELLPQADSLEGKLHCEITIVEKDSFFLEEEEDSEQGLQISNSSSYAKPYNDSKFLPGSLPYGQNWSRKRNNFNGKPEENMTKQEMRLKQWQEKKRGRDGRGFIVPPVPKYLKREEAKSGKLGERSKVQMKQHPRSTERVSNTGNSHITSTFKKTSVWQASNGLSASASSDFSRKKNLGGIVTDRKPGKKIVFE